MKAGSNVAESSQGNIDVNIHIKNGRLIDPQNSTDDVTDVFIHAGKIAAIGKAPSGFKADKVIDAQDRVVCPGLIDLRARLREPGQEYKGNISSETRAAARGGVTTLCTLPDTDPIIDTPAVVDLIEHRVRESGSCKVKVLGALTVGLQGKQLSEINTLKQAGCAGVSNAYEYISNSQIMRRAMEYVASLDMTLFLHAEDSSLASNGCAHEGEVSTRLGLAPVPECAETIAVARDIMLIEQTGIRAHFCQISTQRAMKMIARAQHDGLPITADVAAHQLHLTEMDIGFFNSNCHVRPPLRSEQDRTGLRQGVRDATFSVICSDHQPHDVDAKIAPFAQTEPGVSAIETLLPLALRLAEDGMEMTEIIARLSTGPAKVLGVEGGSLGVNMPADVCIFDPQAWWTVSSDELASHGKNTPFMGWELKGRVTHTLLDGEIVFEL